MVDGADRGLELGTRIVPLGLGGGAKKRDDTGVVASRDCGGIDTNDRDSDELTDNVDNGVEDPWDIADAFCFFLNLS